MIRVLSPHLDDAVLSLGQYLQTDLASVHTIFAGLPLEGLLTEYDRACGFDSSSEAMRVRRVEDAEACELLDARSRPMDFLDLQYRKQDVNAHAIISRIRKLASAEIHLFAPLGLGHPDHRLVSRCARLACPPEIIFYEDLPYKCLWPEQVSVALDEIRAEGWTIDPDPWPLPQGDRALKEKAIACYRSQYPNGADDPCVLVPERAWRATR